MHTKRVVVAVVAMIACSRMAYAQTIFTNTRTEVAVMAGLWEVDSLQVSALANAQYPSIGGGTNLWQFLFPSGGINSDGDEDIEMGVASSGHRQEWRQRGLLADPHGSDQSDLRAGEPSAELGRRAGQAARHLSFLHRAFGGTTI